MAGTKSLAGSTFTPAVIEHFIDLARSVCWDGVERFTWDRSKGGHRPTGKADTRLGLRVMLAERQGCVCPVCGGTVKNGEVNHVVTSGESYLSHPDHLDRNGERVTIRPRRGFFPGNAFLGCAACNAMCANTYGRVIPFDAFARPDVMPMGDWPTMAEVARYAASITPEVKASLARQGFEWAVSNAAHHRGGLTPLNR